MKLITRDTDYAIRALCAMASCRKERLNVGDLCTRTRIPRPFLRKILQVLSRKRIISSSKGRSGGFLLSKDPEDISLIDLIKIFQRDIRISEHIFKKQSCCNVKTCKLKKVIDDIEKYAIVRLKSVFLSSLYNN